MIINLGTFYKVYIYNYMYTYIQMLNGIIVFRIIEIAYIQNNNIITK